MTRRPDWQVRLTTVVNARIGLPYEYGMTDCWCFAREAVEAVTGVVLMPDVDPPKGWLAAARVLIARGWSSIEDMMTELLGEPLDDPLDARAGDIISYEGGGEYHLAVCMGDEALAPQTIGLRVIGRASWRRAWKVG